MYKRWNLVLQPCNYNAGVTADAAEERHMLEVGRGRMISPRPQNKQTAKTTGGWRRMSLCTHKKQNKTKAVALMTGPLGRAERQVEPPLRPFKKSP